MNGQQKERDAWGYSGKPKVWQECFDRVWPDAFRLGAESKQAEIDKLRAEWASVLHDRECKAFAIAGLQSELGRVQAANEKLRAELAEYQNMERVSCIGQLNEYACFELVNNRGYKMSTPLFAHPTKEQGK